MRIAFLVLAHDHPANAARLVERLTAEGDYAIVHWDRKSRIDTAAWLASLSERARDNTRLAERFSVGWGQWTMIEATLACISQALALPDVDYLVLVSGADYPIRPLKHLRSFLAADPTREYIECVDPYVRTWTGDGMSHERYQYRHWVSWREHPILFQLNWRLQARLGFRRSPPQGIRIHLGSQWWALTAGTVRTIMAMMAERPEIRTFFRTVWVPDEMFFQSMVASLVPAERLGPCGLTFYHFTPYGRPVVLYDDHVEFLRRQEFFFARKISPGAHGLRDSLDRLNEETADEPLPPVRLCRHVEEFDRHIASHLQGLFNTRRLGRIEDELLGDLEWNALPYVVLAVPKGADVAPLRARLETIPGVRIYGDVFAADGIDYGGHPDHPAYPSDRPPLRDVRPADFLCDLVQHTPDLLTGFVLPMPCRGDILQIVSRDPNAHVVALVPPPLAFRQLGIFAENGEAGTQGWAEAGPAAALNDLCRSLGAAGRSPLTVSIDGPADGGPAVTEAFAALAAGLRPDLFAPAVRMDRRTFPLESQA